eukprot:EG_transcript_45115
MPSYPSDLLEMAMADMDVEPLIEDSDFEDNEEEPGPDDSSGRCSTPNKALHMEKMAPEATDEDSKQSWTTPFDGPLHLENTSMDVGLLETADAEVAIEMDGAGGEEGTEAQSEAASHAPRPGLSAMERAGWFSRLTFG